MNHQSTAHGSIVGVVAAVPKTIITNADCPDPDDANEAAKVTGVRERRWLKDGETSLSLCKEAASALLGRIGWLGGNLDLIVYVTQTPERKVPADVYDIAAWLGASCPCMQVNWSCSGYVYGLWTAMKMIEPGQRALLLVGDASSKITDPGNRATAPLFGDAGSATAIIGGGPAQHFVLGSDGLGADKLCTRGQWLDMDGASVFNFTLKRVPPLVADVAAFGVPDVWLLHQANSMMLAHLTKKCGLDPTKVPSNIARFGNTSCASIPLLMCAPPDIAYASYARPEKPLGQIPGQLPSYALMLPTRYAMLGFGAGFAWCGASITMDRHWPAELIEI